ncbi:7455_t:CDS:2 [Ambispora gerdemannii]|uniref:7455_t:CDS:1 n=1 Tax=Ambispora gerdemannii TaxID=144530 RepID=A0A9N8YQ46_9GLOM|nr:7455_t:CDS:2 [Ambispora gerdemannii]
MKNENNNPNTTKKPEYIVGPWSEEEDKRLQELFSIYDKQWHLISLALKETRSYKQIRERWVNHLDPKLNKDPLSDEEKAMILRLYDAMGPKWALIAKTLPARGRTPLMIRNFWYSEQRTESTRIQAKMSIEAILNNDPQPTKDLVIRNKRRRTNSMTR